MTIRKVDGGWVILHHRTRGKIGQRIPATKKPVSHEKVLQIHRGIMASKQASKQGRKMVRKKVRIPKHRRDGVVQRYWVALGRLVKNPVYRVVYDEPYFGKQVETFNADNMKDAKNLIKNSGPGLSWPTVGVKSIKEISEPKEFFRIQKKLEKEFSDEFKLPLIRDIVMRTKDDNFVKWESDAVNMLGTLRNHELDESSLEEEEEIRLKRKGITLGILGKHKEIESLNKRIDKLRTETFSLQSDAPPDWIEKRAKVYGEINNLLEKRRGLIERS